MTERLKPYPFCGDDEEQYIAHINEVLAAQFPPLLPCPFCGGSKFHIKEFDGVLEDCTVFHVRCMDCGAEMEGEGVNPDPKIRREWALKDAVDRWNRRVCDVKRT